MQKGVMHHTQRNSRTVKLMINQGLQEYKFSLHKCVIEHILC